MVWRGEGGLRAGVHLKVVGVDEGVCMCRRSMQWGLVRGVTCIGRDGTVPRCLPATACLQMVACLGLPLH